MTWHNLFKLLETSRNVYRIQLIPKTREDVILYLLVFSEQSHANRHTWKGFIPPPLLLTMIPTRKMPRIIKLPATGYEWPAKYCYTRMAHYCVVRNCYLLLHDVAEGCGRRKPLKLRLICTFINTNRYILVFFIHICGTSCSLRYWIYDVFMLVDMLHFLVCFSPLSNLWKSCIKITENHTAVTGD
jgi:hypothetical protein